MQDSRAARPRLDRTLGALADPTRRAILDRLAGGEARVTDLARPFDMSLNAVSKHIRVLEQAGLVVRTRRGREHVLALDRAPLDEAFGWIAARRGPAQAAGDDAFDLLLEAERTGERR
jgi:DNA-binding transcriptional ArsR family regulator